MRSHLLRYLLLPALITPLPGALLHAQSAGQSAGPDTPPPTLAGHRQPPTPATELTRLARLLQAAGLPLSDAQSATILGILQDRDTAMKALRSSTVSQADAQSQRQQLLAASDTSIRAALTGAQVKLFDALRPPPPGSAPPSGAASAAPPTDGIASGPGAPSLIDANTGGDPRTN